MLSRRSFSASGCHRHEKIGSNHCRVVQKQGVRKYSEKATWHHLGLPNGTVLALLGVILASKSKKNRRKTTFQKKKRFLNNRQNARPEARRPFGTTRDVRPRRPNGAIFNGKVKAGRQKAPHLGPGFEPKRGTSENQTRNYQ